MQMSEVGFSALPHLQVRGTAGVGVTVSALVPRPPSYFLGAGTSAGTGQDCETGLGVKSRKSALATDAVKHNRPARLHRGR